MTLKLFKPGQEEAKETTFSFAIPASFLIIKEGKGSKVATNPLPDFAPIKAYMAYKVLELAQIAFKSGNVPLRFTVNAPIILEFLTDMVTACTAQMLQDIAEHPERYQEQPAPVEEEPPV